MVRSLKKMNVGALCGMCVVALALPAGPPALAESGPGDPGVARISAVDGNVDVRRSDAQESYAAVSNAPVTVGDYIETQGGARAEVQFDHAMALRVAPQTQLRFTHLTPGDHELQLAQGTVELRLFRGAEGRPAVQTPSAEIHPDDTGRYRVSVDGNGATTVTVRSGHADVGIAGVAGTQTLSAGQGLEIATSGNPPAVSGIGPVAYDSFDGWSDARDGGWSHVSNWAYVDAGVVGANDLSAYGQWTSEPDYGSVWVPSDEPADWSPYSDGRWVWEPDYGWTWIGYEPWGYAPYHYGRWFRSADRGWCWTPQGGGDAPYAYVPAGVGFFALGSGIGLSFSIGDVGWVPLAPGEAYNPWWGGGGYGSAYGGRYYDRGNLVISYRNARYAGAAIAVSGRDFAAGNFAHEIRVRPNQYRNAASFRGVVPVVPTARNLAFSGRAISPARGFATSRHFARMAAPRVVTTAFAQQRSRVAVLARKQYPVARGVGFTGASAAKAGIARASGGKPHVAVRPRPASVWDRFAAKPPTAHGARPASVSRAAAPRAPHDVTAQRASTRHPSVAPKAAAYAAPRAAVSHRSVTPVKRAYVPPAAQHHAAGAPAHAYVVPRTPVAHAVPAAHVPAPVAHAARPAPAPHAARPAPAPPRQAPPPAHPAPAPPHPAAGAPHNGRGR